MNVSNQINDPIRVAVIGVGRMGKNHLRVYNELKGVELIGIYDPDKEMAQYIASQYNCISFDHIDNIVKVVDAVSICSPSESHAEIGRRFLEGGVHCLIEKPLATTESDCVSLIDAANNSNAALLVGHIERFNPAVQQLSNMLTNEVSVYAIEASRLSAVADRNRDIDVVADLMVHDLEIILSLMNKPIIDITARGVSTHDKERDDYVSALITFSDGILAQVTASRITQNQVRKLFVTTDHGLIEVNYANQDLQLHQQGKWITYNKDNSKFGEYVLDKNVQRAKIHYVEPLRLELNHFLDVVNYKCNPIVNGEKALEALRLVWRIQNILSSQKIHENKN